MWLGKNEATGRKCNMQIRMKLRLLALTRSLRSYRETAAGVTSSKMTGHASSTQVRKGRKKDAALPFFHRLRPPDKHHEI